MKYLYAIEAGRYDEVRKCIDSGVDVDFKDEEGQTALIWSTMFGKSIIAEYLIKRGAKVNAKNKSGWTALHFAAFKSDMDMVQLLAENGGDINLKDNDGRTPIDLAKVSYTIASNKSQPITSSSMRNQHSKSPHDNDLIKHRAERLLEKEEAIALRKSASPEADTSLRRNATSPILAKHVTAPQFISKKTLTLETLRSNNSKSPDIVRKSPGASVIRNNSK